MLEERNIERLNDDEAREGRKYIEVNLGLGVLEEKQDRQQPCTPSTSDHAPSPSETQRRDDVPSGAQQLMPNIQRPSGAPGRIMGGAAATVIANQSLEQNGINQGDLSNHQFTCFQQQKKKRLGAAKTMEADDWKGVLDTLLGKQGQDTEERVVIEKVDGCSSNEL